MKRCGNRKQPGGTIAYAKKHAHAGGGGQQTEFHQPEHAQTPCRFLSGDRPGTLMCSAGIAWPDLEQQSPLPPVAEL